LDIPCVLFFKTRKPIEPVEFVKRICVDAAAGVPRRSRFVNRLTPMVMMGKATESGLDEVGKAVLEEVFGAADENEKKEVGGETEDCLTVSSIFPHFALFHVIQGHFLNNLVYLFSVLIQSSMLFGQLSGQVTP